MISEQKFLLFCSVSQFSCSVMSNSLWRQASLSITNSQSLLKPMSIESVMPSNHLILCVPLLLPYSIFPSIRVFSNESTLCMRWLKYWSFSFSISPSNEYAGLNSFRMDWLELFVVQGSLKSLLQHHSSKASILWQSAFFMVQLSYPYMTWPLEKPYLWLDITLWTKSNFLQKLHYKLVEDTSIANGVFLKNNDWFFIL